MDANVGLVGFRCTINSLWTLQVTVFDIRPAAEAGVETIVGDLREPEGVNAACRGAVLRP